MSTNKFIFYLLYNKGIIVNLYKLYFPSFPFSLQPNKRVLHPQTFPPSNQTHKRENQIFLSSHFSILPQFSILSFFHSSNQMDPKDWWIFVWKLDAYLPVHQPLLDLSKFSTRKNWTSMLVFQVLWNLYKHM